VHRQRGRQAKRNSGETTRRHESQSEKGDEPFRRAWLAGRLDRFCGQQPF
jgi:hypothetical protein